MSSIPACVDETQDPTILIAKEATTQNPSNTPGEPDGLPNKYIFPEFAGFSGERYLLSLAEKIAPLALWRTWQAMVSYEAPSLGLGCYVGVELLTDPERGKVGVKERKIYKDIEALKDRGWLRLERVRRPFPQPDGSIIWHTVTVKDFTGFYKCAHEYHLWLQDKARYIAPDRENRELIRADKELEDYLIQFENYRRVILHDKPGRKTAEQPSFVERQIAALAKIRNPVPKVNQDINSSTNTPSNTSAAYELMGEERNRKGEDGNTYVKTDSNISTPERSDVGGAAIGKTNGEQSSPSQSETKQPIEQQNQPSKPNTPHPEKEVGAAAAIEALLALGYTEEELKRDVQARGAALAGIPAVQHRKLSGGQDRQEEEHYSGPQLQRPLREFPDMLGQTVIDFAAPYDDENLLRSDETRIKKLYATAEQAIAYFSEKQYWPMFDAAKAAGVARARKRRNSKGRVTPVPYMFTCLENALGITLEELVYMRTDDPLYTDYPLWDFIDRLREMHHQEQYERRTPLGYREWLEELLDQLEKRKEHKERRNPVQRKY